MSLRLALCQIDTVPGDVPGNLRRIQARLREAEQGGADLAVFPELALAGYPPRDLVFRAAFMEALGAALEELAASLRETAALVGTVVPHEGPGRRFRNAALLLLPGGERKLVAKSLLPVYDVFEETRYFEPGAPADPVPFRGRMLGINVCEDLWARVTGREVPIYALDPPAVQVAAGADLILNLSASPYHQGKPEFRERLVRETALRTACPTVLVNLVGANDEIIFDGGSVVADATGEVIARAPLFEEALVFVDLPATRSTLAEWPADPVEEMRQALVLGIRDYARKCGFGRAVVGLSGGVDSAVTAALACDALGAGNVTGVAMPSPFSSPESVEDAALLARMLGMRHHVVSIASGYEALLGMAHQVVGQGPFGVMEENIQARVRGVLLMAISNREGSLLLTTGNKSEMAVGYCTLYGDMSGGLAALSDVWKTDVYRLARLYLAREMMPHRTITKPPSAELRPGQLDQDTLPPYDILDRILDLHIEEGCGTRDIIARMPDLQRATVSRVRGMVAVSETKRKQAAPGLRVSTKAFGVGRRIPLVSGRLGFLEQEGP